MAEGEPQPAAAAREAPRCAALLPAGRPPRCSSPCPLRRCRAQRAPRGRSTPPRPNARRRRPPRQRPASRAATSHCSRP
eukprot:scaffold4525_cov67-Phaeocystis_antarctica.AAC.4